MNELMLSGDKKARDVRVTNIRLLTMTRETDVFKLNNARLMVMESIPFPQYITNLRLMVMEKVN